MVVEIAAKWKAGGVTMPIYEGEERFKMNCRPDEKPEDTLDIARQRARLMVKRKGFENAPLEIISVAFV